MDKFNFWDFGVIDFIDVFLVAILLYYIYKLIKGTVAINIFIGIIIIFLAWKLTVFLKMGLLSQIFSGFMDVGIIALIVVFQPEIRKFLLMVGSTNLSSKRKFLSQLKFLKNRRAKSNRYRLYYSCLYQNGFYKNWCLNSFRAQ